MGPEPLPFNPTTDVACPATGPCLTSFFWCGRHEDSDDTTCTYPDNVDPYDKGNTESERAVLYLQDTYNVSWKNAAAGGGPVLLEWMFPESVVTKGGSDADLGPTEVRWAVNVTEENWFQFKPIDALREFPTEHAPEMSPNDGAVGAASLGNFIRISQPELGGSGSEQAGYHVGHEFTVQSQWSSAALDNYKDWSEQEKKDERRKWDIGVGVGVGIGVPLLMAGAFFMGIKIGVGEFPLKL